MTSRLIAGSLLALSATGCLATKGDIRLLQDELRATRASVARSDSARRLTSDSLRAALANLASLQTRAGQDAVRSQRATADELKALSTKVNNNDIATKEQLKSLTDDVEQLRELSRQNARGSAVARAQAEQAARTPVVAPDTSVTPPTTPAPAGATPGPATLLVTGRSLIVQGSCSTARRNFQEIVTTYPQSLEAPEAQYSIADSYTACGDGNTAKADSVYQTVTERYPKSDFAAMALYKRAETQRSAGRNDLARPLYAKIVCEYPRSTVYPQALDRVGTRPVCR